MASPLEKLILRKPLNGTISKNVLFVTNFRKYNVISPGNPLFAKEYQ